MSERFATVDGLTRSVEQLAAGDPRATRVIYAIVIALIVVGVVLVVLAIWMIRRTRADPELLAPLERMSESRWRKSGPEARRALLDEVRPAGAAVPTWPQPDGVATPTELPPPLVEAPVVEVPAVESASDEARVAEAPDDEAPADEVPVAEAPIDEESPLDEVPVAEAPIDEEAPVNEEAPIAEAPIDEDSPVDEAPGEASPVVDVPADASPVAVSVAEPEIAESLDGETDDDAEVVTVDVDVPAAATSSDVGTQVVASEGPATEQ